MSRFDDMVNGLRDEMDIPEDVWRGYVQALADLPEKNGGRNSGGRKTEYRDKGRRKRKAAGGAAFLKAAALVLISITVIGSGVYAAEKYFGILDFLRGNENIEMPVPAEAEDLIVPIAEEEQEKAVNMDGIPAEYTVKEAMCDSESVYVVLEARAKETGRFLFVPEDAIEEDPVADWGIDSDMSVGEYAASKNLEIKHVNAGIQNTDELGIAVSTIYFQALSDDVMDIMIECGKTQKEKTLDVVCTGILWDETMVNMEDIMRTEIRFTLTDISDSEAAVYVPSGTAEIPGTGAVIERAEVIQTELGTYLEILYKDESQDMYAAPCFRLSGNEGEEHRIRMASGTEILADGEYFWKLSLEKMELGDNITLEAYNAETKEVYGTFELIRQQG